MLKKLPLLYSTLKEFEAKVSPILECLNLNPTRIEYEIDHLAIQAASTADGEILLRELIQENSSTTNPVSDTTVNDRRVLLFKIKQPVTLFGSSIEYIELLFPKPHKMYSATRFEHLEVVIPYESGKTVFAASLIKTIGENTFARAKQLFSYRESNPPVRGQVNPELAAVVFSNPDNLSVKFHPVPLYTIAAQEKQNLLQ